MSTLVGCSLDLPTVAEHHGGFDERDQGRPSEPPSAPLGQVARDGVGFAAISLPVNHRQRLWARLSAHRPRPPGGWRLSEEEPAIHRAWRQLPPSSRR